MKKLLLILTIVLLILGCSASAAAQEEGEAVLETIESAEGITEPVGEDTLSAESKWVSPTSLEGWMAYIQDELLPIITAALAVVASIYVAISPVLSKIKKASEHFKSATTDVNTATGTVKGNEKKIEELEARLAEKIGQMERESAANRRELVDIKEMLCLGLGNMNELVAKGTARSIVKLGKVATTEEAVSETVETAEGDTNETDHKA